MILRILIFLFFCTTSYAQQTNIHKTLCQEAMMFIHENWNECYSFSSDDVSNYYHFMDSVFSRTDVLTNNQYREAYNHALHHFPFVPSECQVVYDSQILDDNYLKRNFENAYGMWKRNSHKTSFETFCNYVLPYRIGNEPLSDWRMLYQNAYNDVVRPYFSKQHNFYYAFSIHNVLNKDFNGAVYYPSSPLPEFSLVDLLKVKISNCEEYAVRGVAQLRAFGIPATIDYVPQWGNRSMGHSWAVMFLDDTHTLPFGLNEALGSHFDDRPDLTIPKVYRRTFKKQSSLQTVREDPDPNIPVLFRNDRYIDVTDTYVETSSVTISVPRNKWSENTKRSDLAVFNNHEWVPVAISTMEKDMKVTFHKVGRSVMYVVFFFDEFGRKHYASDPFLLDKDGTIRYITADKQSVRTISVTRKYMETEALKKYNRQLEGGKVIVSDSPDFKDSTLVLVIDSIRENRYNTIPLQYSGKYRYLKYLSPKGSYGNIAEIQLYDDDNSVVTPVRCFGGRGAWEEHSPEKVFDGNELTSYSRISPDGAWAAAEFASPVHFSKLRIHPRTDGNAIYAGDVYQLLYWGNGKWNLIAEHKAGNEDSISFANVPTNALLLLHNASRGREERIFTYENGKQIWW